MNIKNVAVVGTTPQLAVAAMDQESIRQFFTGEGNGDPEILFERKEREAKEEAIEVINLA